MLIEKQNNKFGIVFYLFCPANPTIFDQPMIMFSDGSIKDNINFKTVCPLKQTEQSTRIVYDRYEGIFVYPHTGKLMMEEFFSTRIGSSLQSVGVDSLIGHDWEIYKLLFIMHNVNPVWIKVSQFQLPSSLEVGVSKPFCPQMFSDLYNHLKPPLKPLNIL